MDQFRVEVEGVTRSHHGYMRRQQEAVRKESESVCVWCVILDHGLGLRRGNLCLLDAFCCVMHWCICVCVMVCDVKFVVCVRVVSRI